DEEWDRARPAEALEERLEVREVEEHLRHGEAGTCLELPLEALELVVEVVGRWVHGYTQEEGRRCVDLPPVVVLSGVHPRDHLREADGIDFIAAVRCPL